MIQLLLLIITISNVLTNRIKKSSTKSLAPKHGHPSGTDLEQTPRCKVKATRHASQPNRAGRFQPPHIMSSQTIRLCFDPGKQLGSLLFFFELKATDPSPPWLVHRQSTSLRFSPNLIHSAALDCLHVRLTSDIYIIIIIYWIVCL